MTIEDNKTANSNERPVTYVQSFILRTWREPLGAGTAEWRGSIEQVSTGEIHYFRDWPELLACLIAMLPESPEHGQGAAEKGRGAL
jgi:hypothetical protein